MKVVLVPCSLCGRLIAHWRTLCTRCAFAISDGWPDV
jgi:hypothetical protein